MKKITKIIPAVMLAASLATTALAAPNAINVNSSELEGVSYIVNEGKTMIPVRAICEKLGFAVEYDDASHIVTLVKLPVTISFLPTVDGYTFARTAPLKLGTDPILINDRTYVPVEFITEILKGEYTIDGDVVSIRYGEEVKQEETQAETVKAVATIVEIGDGFVTVMDYVRGEVVVHIAEDTKIVDEDGKAIALADIDMSKEFTVEYAPAMTMSIPPQTTGIKLVQTDAEGKDVVEGEVCEIIAENGKVTAVVVGEKEDPMTQIVLNLGEDTEIAATDGADTKIDDVKEGTYIRALASKMTTRSIPAQKPCYSITIQ